MPKERPQSE
jgi:hypothetical protein